MSIIKVGKVNTDEQSALAEKFGIISIPTLVAPKDGKIANPAVGANSKEQILSML